MMELYPIKTYSEELDKIIGGFYPGELTLLCGANGFGDESSEFIFSLVKMITFATGMPGILYNFGARAVFDRLITSAIGIPWWERKRLKNEESDVELNNFISKQVYDLPLIVRYNPNLLAQGFYDDIRKLYKYKDIKIIYLDGIHASGGPRTCFFFQKLKELSQEMNIPIIVAYYRRGIDVINDEEIVKISDTIITFNKHWTSSDYSFYQMPFRVIKTHDGKIGTFSMTFCPHNLVFPEL